MLKMSILKSILAKHLVKERDSAPAKREQEVGWGWGVGWGVGVPDLHVAPLHEPGTRVCFARPRSIRVDGNRVKEYKSRHLNRIYIYIYIYIYIAMLLFLL